MEGYPEFFKNFKSIKIIFRISTETLKPYSDFPKKQLDSSDEAYKLEYAKEPETKRAEGDLF
jgi:hypothetical protein